ncbi:serine/threonine-protein kinase [Magnetococcus sp. PR-3]|uniref:serine/threonine-protein kinase n=1 Tax=Magnetococcus sp. PR-3 TaxID=3120355 RepID=UPI002FCE4911
MRNRALPEGFELGNYQIQMELARSAYAIVYLAFHASGPVVIKEFMPQIPVHRGPDGQISVSPAYQAPFDTFRQRFRYEVQLLAHLKHAAIRPLLDHFDTLGSSYMVLRYVQGENLEQLAHRRSLIEWEIHQLLDPICSALNMLHELGQSHLNLHPSSILLQTNGQPILTNFGSAWSLGSLERGEAHYNFDRGYSSLELHHGKNIGPASDLYTLGATLYRLITAEPPVNSVVRYLYRKDHGEDPYRPLHLRFVEHYSKPLLAAIDAALILDVEDRPQDIKQWLATYGLDQTDSTLKPPHTKIIEGDQRYRQEHYDEAQLAYMEAARAGSGFAHRAIADLRLRTNSQQSREAAKAALFSGSGYGDLEATLQLAKLLKTNPELRARGMTPAIFYKQAAQQGHSKAMYRFALEKFIQANSEEIASRAVEQGISWLWRSAHAGFDEAQWALAQDLDADLIPCKEEEHALVWLRYAAHQGWVDAQLQLAKWCLEGHAPLTEPNPLAAYYWYLAAAEAGDEEAQLELAQMFMDGRGIKRNAKEAYRWRESAALKGCTEAHYLMAVQMRSGNGTQKNLKAARTMLETLAFGGHGLAQKLLALMMARGEGGTRHPLHARHWYKEAAKQGVKGAQEALDKLHKPPRKKTTSTRSKPHARRKQTAG